MFHKDVLMITSIRFIEEEYGEDVLEALVRAKDNKYRELWRKIAETTSRSDPEYLFRLFNDRVHEYEVMRKDKKALEIIVTRCQHAETFQKFNAEDIGMKMICMGDYAVVEGFNPEIEFKRIKTLMAGDECCHFIFELNEG